MLFFSSREIPLKVLCTGKLELDIYVYDFSGIGNKSYKSPVLISLCLNGL